MSFIEQNYLWFIIGGIVIVMIIIGYIAEKTDFGHKKIEKQEKPKKKPEKEVNLENVKLSDVVYKKDEKKDEPVISEPLKEVVDLNKKNPEIIDPLPADVIAELSVPLDSKSDATKPLKDEKVQVKDAPKDIKKEGIDLPKEELEKLSVPLNPSKEVEAKKATPTPLNEKKEEKELSKEELEKLSVPIGDKSVEVKDNVWVDEPIKETKNDTQKVESEEDIWKF